MRIMKIAHIYILMSATLFLTATPWICLAKEPTATVIDDETGKPIVGAVAIAIWRKHSNTEGAWFEGGADVPYKIEEVVSDNNGNLFIPGFWDKHFFKNRYPHLTVYKPGYVCWDQQFIYVSEHKWNKRNDFSERSNVIKMKKWPKEFSFFGHAGFVSSCTLNQADRAEKKLFIRRFDYEIHYRQEEINK